MNLKEAIDIFNQTYLTHLNSSKRTYEICIDKKEEYIIYNNLETKESKKILLFNNSKIAGIYSNDASNKIEFKYNQKIDRYTTSFKKHSDLIKIIAVKKGIDLSIEELSKLAIVIGYINSLYHLVYTIDYDITVLSDTRRMNMLKFQHQIADNFLRKNLKEMKELISN